MPPKRKTSPPAKRATRARPAAQAVAAPTLAPLQSGRLLSGEEKHQLILAHAAAREPGDPVQVLSMWAGVLAVAFVIAVGWWWAMKPMLTTQVQGDLKPAVTEMTQNLTQGGTNMLRNMETAWAPIKQKLETYRAQAETEQTAQTIADQVNGARNVFAATSTGAVKPSMKK